MLLLKLSLLAIPLCQPVSPGGAPEDPADDPEHDEAEPDADDGDDRVGVLLRERQEAHDGTPGRPRRTADSTMEPTTPSGPRPASAAAA